LGWQVEIGVSGYAGGIGASAKVGYFPDDGFIAKIDAIAGIGGGLIIRVKP
jgi:general stress protein CsbA